MLALAAIKLYTSVRLCSPSHLSRGRANAGGDGGARGAAAAVPTSRLRGLIGAGGAGVFCTAAPGPPWPAAGSVPGGRLAAGSGGWGAPGAAAGGLGWVSQDLGGDEEERGRTWKRDVGGVRGAGRRCRQG